MDLEKLKEVYQALSMFKVLKCDMVHEKVLSNKATGLPQKNISTSGFERMGLCPKSIRDFRLGCAHTVSNHNFMKHVRQLAESLQEFEKYPSELDRIFLEIYKIDHLKGDLEKGLAESLFEEDDSNRGRTEDSINEVLKDHRQLLDKLDVLRSMILLSLKEKIRNHH